MLTDEEIKTFLSTQNLILTKENSNPRPFDQKVTMDNVNTNANLILQITDFNKKSTFTVTEIWKNDITEAYVQIYGKGSVYERKSKSEWDKFFAQPINFLTYFSVLRRGERKGRSYIYYINNINVLNYIASQSYRSLKFLIFASLEFSKQNKLDFFLNDFFNKETEAAFQDLRNKLKEFIYTNTNITEKNEPSRIYNKIINHIAYHFGKKGTDRGHISEDKIQLEELQYNQKNWHDLNFKKPKNISREEWHKSYYRNLDEDAGFDICERSAKKKLAERYGQKSEFSGENNANETHHIFMKSEFPKIKYFHENLIRITANEHLIHAHPNGNRRVVDKKFQLKLLLAKLNSIKKSIENDDGFYDLKHFIHVINIGFNENMSLSSNYTQVNNFLRSRV